MRKLRAVAYQFLISEALDEAVVEWRRRQPDLPTKAEAVRRLLEQALGLNDGEDGGGQDAGEYTITAQDEQQLREVCASKTRIPEKAAAIRAGKDRYSTKPCKHGHLVGNGGGHR
jgi:hypothetical protein